jgi:hypothetical protein
LIHVKIINEGRRKKEEGRRKKEEGGRKKEEGRKREEGRGKREEEEFYNILAIEIAATQTKSAGAN